MSFRVSHLLVRLAATINFANFGLGDLYTPYFHALQRAHIVEAVLKGHLASGLLLPALVGVEAWWMRHSEAERRPLLIDAAFAGGCVVFCLVFMVYALLHPVFL